jgi:ribose transport system substrate-binding protein
MKKIMVGFAVCLLAACVCGTAFAAGGKESTAAGGKGAVTIGMAMVDLTNPFFVSMMEGGNIAAKEVGVNVIWKSAEGSAEKEIAIIENFVQQKVSCILIDPIDSQAVMPAMKKAFDAGIPLVTMGNYVNTPYGNISTLYNDYRDYKTLTAILAYSIKEQGNVVHIFGKKGNFVSDERLRGFDDGIKQFPGIKLLSEQPGEWDPALSQRIMEDMLTAYPKIDGVAVWHDGIMYSAVTALKNSGRLEGMKVVSYDGDPESSKMVKDGTLVADLLTGAKRIGAWNVKVGASLARGAKLESKVFLPSKFVILEDTLKQLKQNGFNEQIDWITPDEAIRIADSAVVDWKY